MAAKRITLDDKIQVDKKGQGADIFFEDTSDIIEVKSNDGTNNITNDESKDGTDNIVDEVTNNNNSGITNGNINDDGSGTSNDGSNDGEPDESSDENSDIESDITDGTIIHLKKRDKYTDKHIRRTYYILKEHDKQIDKLTLKYKWDKSYIVNEALRIYFELVNKEIEKQKANRKKSQ
jgi:hypothetical protein